MEKLKVGVASWSLYGTALVYWILGRVFPPSVYYQCDNAYFFFVKFVHQLDHDSPIKTRTTIICQPECHEDVTFRRREVLIDVFICQNDYVDPIRYICELLVHICIVGSSSWFLEKASIQSKWSLHVNYRGHCYEVPILSPQLKLYSD